MQKYFVLFVITISPFLFTPHASAEKGEEMVIDSVSGDKASALSHEDWQTTLENIKSDTNSLLEANKQLNSEYDFLKQKLAELQNRFAKVKEENANLEIQNQNLEKSRSDKRRASEEIEQKMLKMQNEAVELGTKNKPFRGQLTQIEEQNEQMQKTLHGLQSQKREILLDLKLQEAARGEAKDIDDEETRKLNQQLSEYQQREKELNTELAQSQDEMQGVLEDIENINKENSEFEAQLSDLRVKKENQIRTNEQLRKENERLAKSPGPADLVKQKNALEAKIHSLTKELDSIRKSVQESSSVLEKKRGLMDEVMKLDAENQELRTQVADLLQKINDLKITQEAPAEPSPAQ